MRAVPQPFDVVLTTNSGYPLDQNLYQAVKGMSAAAKIVKSGGTIVCAAECRDGLPSHGSYGAILRSQPTPEALLSFYLDRVTNCVDHLRQLADLMQTVFSFDGSPQIEPKIDLVRAVGDLKSYLAAVFFGITADMLLARVLNYANGVGTHICVQVQKLASLNVIFIAHFLFLLFVAEKTLML